VFDEHRQNGGAILIVTHSDAIAERADRIIRIEDGRIVKGSR
jgi:putative ABC transport system ATP-binding protein